MKKITLLILVFSIVSSMAFAQDKEELEGVFDQQRATATKATAKAMRKEATALIKEQDERVMGIAERVRVAAEKVQFEEDSGQITEQEAAQKRVLLDKATAHIEVMKKMIETEKEAIRKITGKTE